MLSQDNVLDVTVDDVEDVVLLQIVINVEHREDLIRVRAERLQQIEVGRNRSHQLQTYLKATSRQNIVPHNLV